MSKYTKEEVIQGRKCGLKYFDKAVEKVGIQAILEKTVSFSKGSPDTWGRGWSNIDWAFGNAWREFCLNKNRESYGGMDSINLNEALSQEQMQYIADQCGLDIQQYVPSHDRKS